jgi:hypothetical protein
MCEFGEHFVRPEQAVRACDVAIHETNEGARHRGRVGVGPERLVAGGRRTVGVGQRDEPDQ